jgi:hypothetical protein
VHLRDNLGHTALYFVSFNPLIHSSHDELNPDECTRRRDRAEKRLLNFW